MKDFNADYLRVLHCPKCGWSRATPQYHIDQVEAPTGNTTWEYLQWTCTRCGYGVTDTKCADAN